LDDEDLDSGDDLDRKDRIAEEEDEAAGDSQEEVEEETVQVIATEMGRHPVPEPSDGEVCLLSIILGFCY
jgi:RNA polymerase-associated protein LEO1